MKDLFSYFVSFALFLPVTIILENKSGALGVKSFILRVHLAIRRSSEKIDPQKIADVILLDKWEIRL